MSLFLISSLLCACIALFAVVLSFALHFTTRRPWHSKLEQSTSNQSEAPIYVDNDGVASTEDLASARDLPQRILLGLTSAALLGLATVYLAINARDALSVNTSIMPAACVGLALHTALTAYTRSSRSRFELGILVSIASILVGASIVLRGFYAGITTLDRFSAVFVAVSAVLTFSNAITALTLKPRPELSRDGRAVDGQTSGSILSRRTFAWSYHLISNAHQKPKLDETDLPLLDANRSAEHHQARFEAQSARSHDQALWRLLLRSHWRTFARQWAVASLELILTFIPEVAMFQLLNALEHMPSSTRDRTPEIAFWIAALGLSSFFHNALQQWVTWIKWSILELNIRLQLKSIIFAKALRLEDIKDPAKSSGEDDADESDSLDQNGSADERTALLDGNSETRKQLANGIASSSRKSDSDDDSKGDGDDDDEDDEEGTGHGRSIVSLIDVDCDRISANAAELGEFVSSIFQLVIGLAFLLKILGWQATLAGISIPLLFTPLHKIGNTQYTKVQTATSAARDKKTEVVSEALHGMRQVKFAALEKQWHQLIMAARHKELKQLWKLFFWRLLITVLWMVVPSILGAASLATYALVHGNLPASVAFTSLAVFSITEQNMNYIPTLVADFADTYVSLNRVTDFLKRPDKPQYTTPGDEIMLREATISWPTHEEDTPETFSLRDVNLQIPKNALTVILGKTGSGKSLLLASMVGEARLVKGEIHAPTDQAALPVSETSEKNWIVPSFKAFVPQTPWLENASLRDNILYGLPLNHARYQKVLHACALEQDLTILHDGDDTEIGASGVNLSGGQKSRLSLARALYSRAGILVLDDVFSAVDSHVGRQILDNAILGELGQQRTIILATHHADLARPVSQYIVEIEANGNVKPTAGSPRQSTQPTSSFLAIPDVAEDKPAAGTRTPRRFVQEEERAEGQVSFKVYQGYVEASGGWWFWSFIVILFTLSGAISIMQSYWIKLWAEGSSRTAQPSIIGEQPMGVYIAVYVGLAAVAAVLMGLKMAIVRLATMRASKELFETLTDRILHANLQWVDTTPVGRILARFVGDFSTLDGTLATWIAFFFDSVFQLVTVIAASLLVSPITIVIVFPIVLGMVYVSRLYLRAARDVKRLEAVSNSPIIDNISSSIAGISTIRAFGKVDFYMKKMCGLLDTQSRANYHLNLLSSWMESRQSMFGSCFEVAIAVFVSFSPNVSAAAAGFILSFALEFSSYIMNVISEYSRLDLDMNSVERIFEYIDVPTEGQDGIEVPLNWPDAGKIVVKDLQVTYAPDLPPALRNLSFTIQPGERVGVVGRTGSGKSSFTLALFRFLEASKGSITVDGVDISKLRLADLRSRLSIIPQDPVLFTGTIRSNLDPFHKYSDASLFSALSQANLLSEAENVATVGDSAPANIFANLSHAVSQGGQNLSQGQRQLLCLARAMLGSPRVMLLDEATSAVDMETDAAIQKGIRAGFAESTLLVVAHRLATIIDFDKVLVLGDGKVLEFGKPVELYRAGGAFADMIRNSGDTEKLVAAMEAVAPAL